MRIKGLDSIRGIAAVVVVFYHALMVYIPLPIISRNFVAHSALGLLLNAPAAVIVFFVLSGFVLTYAIEKDGDWRLLQFLRKRVARLYIPYVCAFLGALALIAIIYAVHLPIPPGQPFELPISAKNWFSMLTMIGIKGDDTVNAPAWTICIEMQAAFLMPFLARAAKQHVALAAFALFAIGQLLSWKFADGDQLRFPWGVLPRLAATVFFLQFFAYGAAIYKFRNEISALADRLPGPVLGGGAILAFACLEVFAMGTTDRVSYSVDAIPACFAIALCACRPNVDRLLSSPVPAYLGKISFSIYLIHMPVLLFVTTILMSTIGKGWALLAGVIVAFPIAHLFNRYVEKPAADLSQRITRQNRIAAKQTKSA